MPGVTVVHGASPASALRIGQFSARSYMASLLCLFLV
jgi:hypothetical protein